MAPALPTTASGARLATLDALPQAELEAYVDGLVKEAMDREHIAGVTLSIVQNGQVVLKKGYGIASLASGRHVNPDTTLFRIGSISKTFTWIALMREVEAGRIRMDGPVNLYLPEVLQVKDQGFRAPVRVINLMDHSAGFEDRALGQLFERDASRERSLADYLRQERPRRIRAPGELSSYSNYGAGLAGEMVSYVSGRPFERQIEDEIFQPLAMNHSTFREPREPRAGLASTMPLGLRSDLSDGFRLTPAGLVARPYEYIGHIAPAGSASSTAGDMAQYMMAILNQGQLGDRVIYGPRTASAFTTPIQKTPPGINGWRHGFMVYGLPGGHQGFGHAGATLSFLSNMVLIPDLNLGIFISTNTETGGYLTERFPDRVISQFYAPPETLPRPGSPGLKALAKTYRGYFLSTRRAYSGLEAFTNFLRAGVSVHVNPEGRLVTSSPSGVQAWVPDGPLSQGRFISATGSARMAFQVIDGRAVSFQGADNTQTFERKSMWRKPSVMIVVAGLALIAAISTIGGLFLRNRREFRETPIQNRASLIQTLQAGLWILAFGLYGIWGTKTLDVANVMYRWPGALLVIASASALVAAFLTIATALILPAVWRGGRRVDSWTSLRKASFSLSVGVYATFSLMLLFWGGLTPWAG